MMPQMSFLRLDIVSLAFVVSLAGCGDFKIVEKNICEDAVLRNFHKCFEDDCDAFSLEISRQEIILNGELVKVDSDDFQIVDAFCGCERVFVVVSYLSEGVHGRALLIVEPATGEINRNSRSLSDLRELDGEPVERLECSIEGGEALVVIDFVDAESGDLKRQDYRTKLN